MDTLPTLDANGWGHRAHAEVQAILQDADLRERTQSFDDVVSLMAIAWLQGFNLGAHETLGEAEQAFTRMQETLTR